MAGDERYDLWRKQGFICKPYTGEISDGARLVAIVSTIVRWKLRIEGAVGGLLEACLVANDLRNVATFSKNAFCRLLSSALLRSFV